MRTRKHVVGTLTDSSDSTASWFSGLAVLVCLLGIIGLGIIHRPHTPLIIPMGLGFGCVMSLWKLNERHREISELHGRIGELERKESHCKIVHTRGLREAMATGDWRPELREPRAVMNDMWAAYDREAERAQMVPVSEIRIGHAEREQVLTELGDHYAEGRLDAGEFETRSAGVMGCKTAAELIELLKDLPAGNKR